MAYHQAATRAALLHRAAPRQKGLRAASEPCTAQAGDSMSWAALDGQQQRVGW